MLFKKCRKTVILIISIVLVIACVLAVIGIYNANTIGPNGAVITNNGEEIKIYKSTVVDLSEQKHNIKENKLFVGWKKSNGKWAKISDKYSRGEVLTAQYINFSDSDFAINDITLKQESELKLLMGFEKTAAVNAIPNINEYGVIWAETDNVGGRELRLDQGVVKTWKWDAENINAFVPQSTVAVPEKAVNTNIATIGVWTIDYAVFYTARGYIKYTDNNGIDGIVYTQETSSSAYKVAKEATDSKPIYDKIINKVEDYNKICLDLVKEKTVNTYDKFTKGFKRNTDTRDILSSVSGTSSCINRKRTVELANIGVKEKVSLGWLTDIHIFDVNQTDVDKRVVNALATYRGSNWLWGGDSIQRGIDQINYANSKYTKTVITGDITDFFSFGSYNAVKALVTDKSINGSMLMTTGNHEFMEVCNADISDLTENYTVEQKYNILKKHWANDPTYYAEILKTTKGQDNAMLILLDNGLSEYHNGTAQKLEASLKQAKEKNIPVLIFQHISMPAYNDNGITYRTSSDGLEYTASANRGVFDSSEGNKKIHTIIRKNSDIIKGVFAGHGHFQAYMEITALDDSGEIIPDKYIPQFLGGGYQQNWINEIVLND